METDEIVEHLRLSLTVVLGREIPEFSPETRLLEDLELDSLRFVELIMSLEDTVGLEVDPETLEPEVFATVASFAEYVRARLLLADVTS